MTPLTPEQEAIKDAVVDEVLKSLLQNNTLSPILLTSKDITKIFRVSPLNLCIMREQGIVPVVKIGRSFRYNPMDLLNLFLTREHLN